MVPPLAAMAPLIAATTLVVLSHAIPSLTPLGPRLRQLWGQRRYRLAHGGVSLMTTALLVWAWGATAPAPSPLDPGADTKTAAVLLMPVAMLLITAGLMNRGAGGIHTITTTPGSLGTALWAGLHLVAVSDARGTVIFTGFLAIALASLIGNARRAAGPPLGWVPFATAVTGHGTLDWRGIGAAPPIIAMGMWAALMVAHPPIFGVAPVAWLLP